MNTSLQLLCGFHFAGRANAGISSKVADIHEDKMSHKQSTRFHSEPGAVQTCVLKHSEVLQPFERIRSCFPKTIL